VRRLSPEIAPFLFEFTDLREGSFEILNVADGFLSLQLKILDDAFFDRGAGERHPDFPRPWHRVKG
jgi:hypothetical protein